MSSESGTTVDLTDSVDNVCPYPINLDIDGELNGVEFNIRGAGKIRTPGVYEATLNFSRIPPNIHPGVLVTYAISCSCITAASTRNGAKNMKQMGAKRYDAERIISRGEEEIVIEGVSEAREECLALDLEVSGSMDVPQDLSGHSAYYVRLEPTEDNRLVGAGEATLYRESGENYDVDLESEYDMEPDPVPNPITEPMYRIVTEEGELSGNTYESRIHSMLDSSNPITDVDEADSRFL